jgi:hypothetical protein
MTPITSTGDKMVAGICNTGDRLLCELPTPGTFVQFVVDQRHCRPYCLILSRKKISVKIQAIIIQFSGLHEKVKLM